MLHAYPLNKAGRRSNHTSLFAACLMVYERYAKHFQETALSPCGFFATSQMNSSFLLLISPFLITTNISSTLTEPLAPQAIPRPSLFSIHIQPKLSHKRRPLFHSNPTPEPLRTLKTVPRRIADSFPFLHVLFQLAFLESPAKLLYCTNPNLERINAARAIYFLIQTGLIAQSTW